MCASYTMNKRTFYAVKFTFIEQSCRMYKLKSPLTTTGRRYGSPYTTFNSLLELRIRNTNMSMYEYWGNAFRFSITRTSRRGGERTRIWIWKCGTRFFFDHVKSFQIYQRHHHTRSYLFSEYQKPSIEIACVYVHETIYVCCHVRLGSHVVKICLKAFSAQLSIKFNPDALVQLEGQPVLLLRTACRTFNEYGPRMESRFDLTYRHNTVLVLASFTEYIRGLEL